MGGGRLKREGIYVYLQLIHVAVQQKLTQHWKAIILQLRKKGRKGGREGGRQEGEKKRKKCWFHPRSMKIRNLEQAIRVNVA